MNDQVVYKFKGPNSRKMLLIYILLAILTCVLIIVFATLFSSFWNIALESNMNVVKADEAHVKNQVPRYIVSVIEMKLPFIINNDKTILYIQLSIFTLKRKVIIILYN
jgi:flagellar basal body-associated protein FliL